MKQSKNKPMIKRTGSLATLVMCLLLSLGMPAKATLVAYWPANGTAVDVAGGHDGSLQGGATYGPGKYGQAFDLDASGAFVSVPDSSDWTFTGDFTIALWVNFVSINSGSLPNRFLAHDEGPGEQDKWIFSYDETGTLEFHINDSVTPVTVTSPGTFAAGTGDWNYFAVTRSGSTYSFYANGTSLGSDTLATPIPDADAALTIGQGEGAGFIDGSLDEVRIYDNALSQSQIVAIMNTVPEPSGMCLLGVGAVWFLRRRRSRS